VPFAFRGPKTASTTRPPEAPQLEAACVWGEIARIPAMMRWFGDCWSDILRGTIKKMADGDKWTMPATIEDPKVLDEIGSALKEKGVGGREPTSELSRLKTGGAL
jgi:hypothetical protein